MPSKTLTPCGALFAIMKKYGNISYKELASLILSTKPLAGGVSPASRSGDRTWVSRYVVHAPLETLKESFFANYADSALRVTARLKSRKKNQLSNEQILAMICGEASQIMADALKACDQDISLYRNVLTRLENESGFTQGERAEIAMVFLVAVGCSGDVRKATDYALDFSREIHGSGVATPLITPDSQKEALLEEQRQLQSETTLGLLRLAGDYVMSSPHWLQCLLGESITIGALATGERSINDVGSDVSGNHAQILKGEDGRWFIQDLGSKNGTVVINGATQEERTLTANKGVSDTNLEDNLVEIHPGDRILLGASTEYIVIAGLPN